MKYKYKEIILKRIHSATQGHFETRVGPTYLQFVNLGSPFWPKKDITKTTENHTDYIIFWTERNIPLSSKHFHQTCKKK